MKSRSFFKNPIFLLPILLLLLTPAVLIGGFSARSYSAHLINEGLRSEGIVVQYFESYDDSPKIKFTFTTQGGEVITGYSDYVTDLGVGNKVNIAYNPTTPSDNIPIQEGINPPIWLLVSLSILYAAIGTIALWLIKTRIDNNERKWLVFKP